MAAICVASVAVALGATAGLELLAYDPSAIVAPTVDPLAGQAALGVFLGTLLPMLAATGLIAALTSSVARRRR